MRLCVYEDRNVAFLEPLTLCRPAFDLWCGSRTLLRRQRHYFGAAAPSLRVRPHLVEVCREAHPESAVGDWSAADPDVHVLVNARWMPPAGRLGENGTARVGLVGDEVAYVVLPHDAPPVAGGLVAVLEFWRHQLPAAPGGGTLFAYPWELMDRNSATLVEDLDYWTGRLPATPPSGLAIVGRADWLRLAADVHIDPHVVIDTGAGPVILDHGVRVEAFSRIVGPCYVGPGTWLMGANVRGSTFGPHCRVGGEVEASIIQGYSNKAHDGFLGHSYVGEWVNLAAGTQVSDLRNDYGQVSIVVAGRKVDTGLMKVGSFIGDHTKTGLNTLFNTGSMIGAFCNLLPTATYLPRVIPSFCTLRNGRLCDRSDWGPMMRTAATVMGRRGRTLSAAQEALYDTLIDQTAFQREAVLSRYDATRNRQTAAQ